MMSDPIRRQMATNWQTVQREVAETAIACGRDPSEIKIIGVSKYVDAECTRALVDVGCVHLGESRPQTLWQKAETLELGDSVTWHMIGHLQTNKVRRLLRHRPIIHSVDSQRLLDCIAVESAAQGVTTRVMLEINISGDTSKTGMSFESVAQLLASTPDEGVEVIGLMAMAGWGTDALEAKQQFDETRQARDQLQRQFEINLSELSMGMSGDFREAIAAGSTMVRIGSHLFEGILQAD